MNPALITFHDSRLQKYADISAETAAYFASGSGLDLVAESTGSVATDAHLKKVELALRELNAGRPYVVWADIDIVFRSDYSTSFLPTYTPYSMSILTTNTMLETSFFIAKNDPMTLTFLNGWYASGSLFPNQTDEMAFHALYYSRPWVKAMIRRIPFNTTIGNPFVLGTTDAVGKHFYSTSSDMWLPQMEQWKQIFFKP